MYFIPPIHSYSLLKTLKAGQNDDLIQVLTSESTGDEIMPFGKPTHTKQNHYANTFSSVLLHKVPLQEGQLCLRRSLLFPNISVLL